MHFAGFAAIAVYLAFTAASIALFPGSFGPFNHWLSDLGNSNFNPKGAILYNAGMTLTGFALVPFFISLKRWETPELHRKRTFTVSRVTGFLCAFGLMFAGVFSEDYVIEHQVA